MAIYTNLDVVAADKHGMFESSNLKATECGNIYDVLVLEEKTVGSTTTETPIEVDNGVAVCVGDYTGNGLQERKGTIAKTTDVIAVTGSPALIKDAYTRLQNQPFNFYHKAGVLAKCYEVVPQDIFAVAKYQFTNPTDVKEGVYVSVDGTGMWTAATSKPTAAFVGKVHSVVTGSFGDDYSMVRILCLKNEA